MTTTMQINVRTATACGTEDAHCYLSDTNSQYQTSHSIRTRVMTQTSKETRAEKKLTAQLTGDLRTHRWRNPNRRRTLGSIWAWGRAGRSGATDRWTGSCRRADKALHKVATKLRRIDGRRRGPRAKRTFAVDGGRYGCSDERG